ncbi:MAG: hypothetical protein N3H31_04685 [Candidatus Nezhaarchaeota archaeon]|nr:hypothetical protein [Candidatus Nezhaarchaeota archaeon]
MPTISVELDNRLYGKLLDEAMNRGVTASEVIKSALEAYLGLAEARKEEPGGRSRELPKIVEELARVKGRLSELIEALSKLAELQPRLQSLVESMPREEPPVRRADRPWFVVRRVKNPSRYSARMKERGYVCTAKADTVFCVRRGELEKVVRELNEKKVPLGEVEKLAREDLKRLCYEYGLIYFSEGAWRKVEE